MIELTNGGMDLQLLSMVGDVALLKRTNDDSFVVCNGLNVKKNLTCDWAFAYVYTEDYAIACQYFTEKAGIKVLQTL